MAFGKQRRFFRLYRNDFNIWIFLFQILSDSAQGSASSYASHKNIHFAIRVVPDFWSCRFIMLLWIGRIAKLARNKGSWNFFGKLFGFRDRALHSFRAFCQFDFRAIRFDQISSLDAHRFWHRQDQMIAFLRAYERESNSCISACWFNDRSARFDLSFFFGSLDHIESDPIFSAACRVERFDFRVYGRFRAFFFV